MKTYSQVNCKDRLPEKSEWHDTNMGKRYCFVDPHTTLKSWHFSEDPTFDTEDARVEYWLEPIELPTEEEIREPIQDALYATNNFNTDQCTELATGIVEYLNEWRFTIIKTK